MSILTEYHNVPTPELVSSLFDKRQHSPVIEELCQRLEDGGDMGKASCPVCEAELFVHDEGDSYKLSLTNEE